MAIVNDSEADVAMSVFLEYCKNRAVACLYSVVGIPSVESPCITVFAIDTYEIITLRIILKVRGEPRFSSLYERDSMKSPTFTGVCAVDETEIVNAMNSLVKLWNTILMVKMVKDSAHAY